MFRPTGGAQVEWERDKLFISSTMKYRTTLLIIKQILQWNDLLNSKLILDGIDSDTPTGGDFESDRGRL